jgi:endonuclease/exonuclease/phosphatase (EEP) superfamily protein YafD
MFRARFPALAMSSLLVLSCGPADSPSAVSRSLDAAPRGSASMAGGNKVIGVMTRNLYLGADLTPVIQSQSLPQFLAATTAVWTMVRKNDFHARAHAVAAEIAANRPALVGLQEAFTWRTQVPADGQATPATDIAYDYVPELIAALAARGLEYRAVATVGLLDFEAPTLLGNDARLTDHGAILARSDVETSNPQGGVYGTLLPLSVLGQPLFVKRGWVSVDVKYRGEQLRFVSTHLESFHAGVRQAQASELATVLASEPKQIILVGDLNSHPGTEGEAILAGAGFSDTWAALHPSNPGLTCCWPEDLTLTAPPFSERIDYVLTRGVAGPVAASVTGSEPASRLSGLWPSDHGGLFAEVRIANEGRGRE